ncbi:hypothetical protein ACFFMR_04070 [Micromonospora andamanensis]|uniref:AraC family transcriptional regulator n=1 Tax=Micromonospora andamanensis TaxID=1287068 RepID=A0ABQ4HZW0_9ACTN|nr:hypothetical protein [Micromonospora andamanensis]GIJ11177.1 hypothetical protein Van01_43910 [Micromonospora andamanensis]
MPDDVSPFFIAPHRFDAVGDGTGPVLDRRHELVPESGEQVLDRHRVDVAGYLLGPSDAYRAWALPAPVAVTVTDHRLTYVGGGTQLAVVGPGPRASARLPGLVSGQIRWQWPSRLELLPADGNSTTLLVICDALRTIRQPALALTGPADRIGELARQLRHAIATFRLVRPELVDLSPPERDALARLARTASRVSTGRVLLPGALPVEFHSRDDYYRPRHTDAQPYDAASGQR